MFKCYLKGVAMSEKKYVLQAKDFAYNDEYYNFHRDGKVSAVLDSRNAAIKAWKELEKKTIASRPLSSIQEFFERPAEELRALDKFLFERSGIHLLDEVTFPGQAYVDEGIESSIAELDEELVFEFLEKAGLLSFSLNEFQGDEKFYIAWLVESEAYKVKYDQYEDELSFSQNFQEIVEECCISYLDECESSTFEGTLESLSHSPALLRTAIASHENLSYDEDAGELLIENDDPSALELLIPLLTKPPFEIRTVSIDEVCEIQAAILDGSVVGAVA
jgi:hypothetical protein